MDKEVASSQAVTKATNETLKMAKIKKRPFEIESCMDSFFSDIIFLKGEKKSD